MPRDSITISMLIVNSSVWSCYLSDCETGDNRRYRDCDFMLRLGLRAILRVASDCLRWCKQLLSATPPFAPSSLVFSHLCLSVKMSMTLKMMTRTTGMSTTKMALT